MNQRSIPLMLPELNQAQLTMLRLELLRTVTDAVTEAMALSMDGELQRLGIKIGEHIDQMFEVSA